MTFLETDMYPLRVNLTLLLNYPSPLSYIFFSPQVRLRMNSKRTSLSSPSLLNWPFLQVLLQSPVHLQIFPFFSIVLLVLLRRLDVLLFWIGQFAPIHLFLWNPWSPAREVVVRAVLVVAVAAREAPLALILVFVVVQAVRRVHKPLGCCLVYGWCWQPVHRCSCCRAHQVDLVSSSPTERLRTLFFQMVDCACVHRVARMQVWMIHSASLHLHPTKAKVRGPSLWSTVPRKRLHCV
mmetsp:Transcript_4316/g.27488  ORF Transcript_4316/g.27488 Transcript_4316/m.27488 type:complete len:237 (-) Transcript_4316:147-857(-)